MLQTLASQADTAEIVRALMGDGGGIVAYQEQVELIDLVVLHNYFSAIIDRALRMKSLRMRKGFTRMKSSMKIEIGD